VPVLLVESFATVAQTAAILNISPGIDLLRSGGDYADSIAR